MSNGEKLRLLPCPMCGAELLPDTMTATKEVVVFRHPYNACFLNGQLLGVRFPHDVEAWNRRSSPSAVEAAEGVDDELTVKVWELLQTVHQPASKVGSDYWHVTAGKHVEFGKLISELHALLASPSPAPTVTLRELDAINAEIDATMQSPPPASPSAPQRVEVKPLEWIKRYESGRAELTRAETIIGVYRVWTYHNAGSWFWELNAVGGGSVASENAGKSACQAHFNAAILSTIQTSPEETGR